MDKQVGNPRRVALVTGATGNLGQVVCKQLSADGFELVRVERSAAYHDEEKLATVDLSSADATRALVAAVVARLGRLDVVVHTVGTFQASGEVAGADLAVFSALFATNVLTTVNIMAASLAHMKTTAHGRLVVVSSTAALSGGAGTAAYSASKAAQLRIVESAAREHAGSDVSVTAVLPGTMDTPANRSAMPDADRARWVSLSEVATVIALLTGPDAGALNGQAIQVAR